MNISIICIGRLKERYWADAANEYIKRLGAYCEPAVIELRESRIHGSGEAAETKVKEEEGRSILSKITVDMYVMTLEIKGRSLSSEQFADKINAIALEGRSNIAFVIGGSLGLSPEVMERSDFRLSLSGMTFPHQMMRVILLEQIYRSFKIIRGEAYHK